MSDDTPAGCFLAAAFCIVAVVLTGGLAIHLGYAMGQQDALSGKWSYQKVQADDGTTKYLELDKPVQRKDGAP